MKKIICLLVSAMLLATPVCAGEIDLSAYSDDDLLALKAQVDSELTNRGVGESAVLQEGVYVVGKDVKAGTYVFTGLVEMKYDDDMDYQDMAMPTELFYYDSEEHYADDYKAGYDYVNPGNPIRKTFEDGQVFEVYYQSVMATYEDALPFAP